ncbi:hypothetical protein NPIL_84661 [Nephila pilipes]|uniref:EGF-like domain-containing protein n=1 Tax=Nephila pilipes TaxID=299642 RepID=A0A8X6QS01_NEPPI|nr:hypothetical protein NPIL_84661 [Nephila pilipes]
MFILKKISVSVTEKETNFTSTELTDSEDITPSDLRKLGCFENPCKNGGNCELQNHTKICNCLESYSGKFCEFDPCHPNPCQNGGTCKPTTQNLGSSEDETYRCSCHEPFRGDNCEEKTTSTAEVTMTDFKTSSPLDPCDPNPCKNKGRCVATQEIGENNGKRYHCRCTGQFTGNDCDIDLITFPEMPTTSAITVSTNSEEDVSPKIDEDLNTKGDLSA